MNNNLSELKSFLKSNKIVLSNELLIAKAMRFYTSGRPKPKDDEDEDAEPAENQVEDPGPDTNTLAEEAIEFALNDCEDFLEYLKKRV